MIILHLGVWSETNKNTPMIAPWNLSLFYVSHKCFYCFRMTDRLSQLWKDTTTSTNKLRVKVTCDWFDSTTLSPYRTMFFVAFFRTLVRCPILLKFYQKPKPTSRDVLEDGILVNDQSVFSSKSVLSRWSFIFYYSNVSNYLRWYLGTTFDGKWWLELTIRPNHQTLYTVFTILNRQESHWSSGLTSWHLSCRSFDIIRSWFLSRGSSGTFS